MMKKVTLLFLGLLLLTIRIYGLTCPICFHKANKFRLGGWVVKRRNAGCPKCGMLERHRNLWLWIQQHEALFSKPHLKILHWAPSKKLKEEFKKRPNISYICADLFPEIYDTETQKLDITQIDLPDDSIDIMICSHVLEHVLEHEKAMKEIYRVLKPGGFALVMVPIYHDQEKTFEDSSIVTPKDRLRHYDQADHVRRYGLDFPDILSQAGFKVDAYWLKNVPQEIRAQYALAGYDYDVKANATRGADIFYCEKTF